MAAVTSVVTLRPFWRSSPISFSAASFFAGTGGDLPEQAFLNVGGADAATLLQNILTNDIAATDKGALVYACLLVSSVGMALMLVGSLWRLCTGRMAREELVNDTGSAGE